VRLDETCGLLDEVRGMPKHLVKEYSQQVPAAAPRQLPAGPSADASTIQSGATMDWAMQGVMSPEATAYPASPTAGAGCGNVCLRDEPLHSVLPRAQPDSIAEKLAEAIYVCDEAEVRRLLANGADPNRPPTQGRHADVKPLALAVRGARGTEVVRVLLEAGATVCPSAEEPGMHSVLQAWASAFIDPMEHKAEIRAKLRLLLEHRVDINARVPHTGDTALHWVAADFQRRRAEGAGPSINRWTTKRIACAQLKFALLLQARADPNFRQRRNQTPLELVSSKFRGELPTEECPYEECRVS